MVATQKYPRLRARYGNSNRAWMRGRGSEVDEFMGRMRRVGRMEKVERTHPQMAWESTGAS